MSAGPIPGTLFDGQSAAATPVTVTVEGGRVRVGAADGTTLKEEALEAVRISEPLGKTPRQLSFAGGVVVEVTDGAALTAALGRVGRGRTRVEWLQENRLAAVGALVATVALLVGAGGWGIPWAARSLVAVAPPSFERKLGDGVLELLELQLLRPSELDPKRQADTLHQLEVVAHAAAPGVQFRVVVRANGGPGSGVNAFALPGGTIVLLDELVTRTGGDARLLAVFAHELGHVVRHHSTQRVAQAAGLGGLATLVWGDASAAAANIPVALALFDYSREAEQEADDDALRFLLAVGLGPRPLFDAFCLLGKVEREERHASIPRLLRTHRSVSERLDHVRVAAGTSWTCPAEPPGDAAEGPAEGRTSSGK